MYAAPKYDEQERAPVLPQQQQLGEQVDGSNQLLALPSRTPGPPRILQRQPTLKLTVSNSRKDFEGEGGGCP